MSKIKLAIAEDHNGFREKIVSILNDEDDFEVILQADNGKELIEKLDVIKPDVILMDIQMPVIDGIQAADQIKKSYPKMKIIAFSQYDNESNIIEMNICGVKSFIGKNDNLEELFNAIRIVNNGGVYMTDYSAAIIQRHLVTKRLLSPQPSLPQKPDIELELIRKFNKTELTILKYISSRMSIKEIARKLFLSPNTINNKQADLRKKLNVKGKGKLLEYALSIKRHLNQLNE